MAVKITDIFAAIALWEQAELPTHTEIVGADQFKAYATFPTPADVDPKLNGPLKYPFTIHWCEKSRWEPVSIITVSGQPQYGSVEDLQEHTIICGLVYATGTTAEYLISQRDAEWRFAYRESFLKNLQLRIPDIVGPNVASSITAIMGETLPLDLDLFNADTVGFQTPITVTIRQKMLTAVGG